MLKQALTSIKARVSTMSFRTGVIVAAACAICYVISFAQMLLPISATAKGVLWVIFFGLAKTCQYTALLILGATGLARLKRAFKAG